MLQEAQLPLWLRPYEVLVTSNRTALIELIPDSLSIHTIKAKSPPGASLRDHFIARHGQVNRASLTCPTGIVQSSYHHQLKSNFAVWTECTCMYLHCLPVRICIVFLSASVLSTCLYLHSLHICSCTVHLSVPAFSTALPTSVYLHSLLVGI